MGAGSSGLQMPTKFAYFNLVTPVGMPSMCLLEMSGKPYEGQAISFADWAEIKPTTPTGKLPYAVLASGKTVCESGAIGRTIAGAAGFIGSGDDFTISEVLVGITTDMNKNLMDLGCTIMNKDDEKAKKKAQYDEKATATIEEWTNKLTTFLLPAGDRFTNGGSTYGEVHLFCTLYCHAKGAFPDLATGKLKNFYDRMAAVPGIKKVIDGESKFGKLEPYLLPY